MTIKILKGNGIKHISLSEAALYSCSYKKVLRKYAENFQEITRAVVKFLEITLQHGCFPIKFMRNLRTPLLLVCSKLPGFSIFWLSWDTKKSKHNENKFE